MKEKLSLLIQPHKWIIRKYFEQVYANILDNFNEKQISWNTQFAKAY